jgi:hypothetical protein
MIVVDAPAVLETLLRTPNAGAVDGLAVSMLRRGAYVAERLNAPHSKCGIRVTVSGI